MKQNFLLKSFVLLIALLAGGISASWGQTTLFYWQNTATSNLSFKTVDDVVDLSATTGTLSARTTDTSKSWSVESATYATSVEADMKDNANGNGLKAGGNANYLVISLSSGTFQEGDIIYISGYNPWLVSTSTSHGGDVSGADGVTTGSSKSDYQVGSVRIPEGINTNTLYLRRQKGSGTGIAAIKIVRPGAATEAFTVTFNAGDYGTCATASLKETSAGAGVTLPAVTPTEGYTFNGWFTAATGGSKAGEAGATYYPTANVTLHAQYTEPVAEPTYKSDFTDGQVIWTTKDEIDAASSGSSPWIVKGDGISNTKDLKGKSFVDPEDEEGDRIAKYSSETPFYIEKTISNKQDLKLYVTGVTRMTFYVWSNSTPDGRVFSIKVNDGDVTDLTFAKGDYNAKYVSVDLEKTANNIIQVYASNELELYAIKAIIDNRAASTFELTSDAAVTLWKDESSTIAFENNAGTVTFSSSDESVATVDADGVITAVAEGTAEITVTDPGSATVMDATEIVTVTVKEHKNTTTENNPGGNISAYLECNTVNESESLSGNSSFGEPVTYGVGSVVTLSSSNNNFQKGGTYMVNGEDKFIPFKVAATTYKLSVADGYELTSATLYVMMNGNSEGTLNGTTTIPAKTNNADMTDATIVLSLDITDAKEFTIEGGQALVCLAVSYTTPKHMILEIKETGYATLFTDYAVAIPDGVEAFTGKYNAETQTVQLTAVTGTIPESTAVILHTKTPGTYSFVKTDDVEAITNNDLVGTLVEKNVDPQSVYTLGLGGADNTVGMRKYNGTKIRAYSAYMEAPANAAPFFNLGYGEEGTTGIRSIDNGQLTIDNVYYDLAGRRVAQPSKGVYIVNGKKVVIK